MLTVEAVTGWLDRWYPPTLAAQWDRVGLIVGSRSAPVSTVLLAVDPVEAVVDQALEAGADLIITHHPLYLRGTSFVSEDEYKGRLVAKLIRGNVALFNAHTNADIAHGGVAQALGDLLGVTNAVPMEVTDGSDGGYGRIGDLVEPVSVAEFARHVAQVLPAGPTGIVVGGDPEREVRRVAVSGGAGDSFLALAGHLGADVFVTADLRHHPASEHLENGGPALICGSHWATEWPWLPVLARKLEKEAVNIGEPLAVLTSTIVTEPWWGHLPTEGTTA